jgi:hypothetical protein
MNVRYDAGSMSPATQATHYNATNYVSLPGGLKLVCATPEQAEALKGILNVMVVEQTTDEIDAKKVAADIRKAREAKSTDVVALIMSERAKEAELLDAACTQSVRELSTQGAQIVALHTDRVRLLDSLLSQAKG